MFHGGVRASEEKTQVSRTLRASLQEFGQRFEALSHGEQDELIRVLTTEMRAWEALPQSPFYGDAHARDVFVKWIEKDRIEASRWEQLNYFSLMKKPFFVKLRFEKLKCEESHSEKVETGGWAAWWKQWWGSPRTQVQARRGDHLPICSNWPVEAVLTLDPGDGRALREKKIFADTEREWVEKVQNAQTRKELQKKLWEELEIFVSEYIGESEHIADRLRVIDVSVDVPREEFLEKRRRAILLRHRGMTLSNPAAKVSPRDQVSRYFP